MGGLTPLGSMRKIKNPFTESDRVFLCSFGKINARINELIENVRNDIRDY